MSKTSALVVTLRKWDVDLTPVEDEHGDLIDHERSNEWLTEYTYARRDYPRGPIGKREFAADIASAFESEGLEFSATGNDWAAQPDGPYIPDYSSPVTREVSMHFAEGTPAWVIRDVMELAR